MYTTTSFNNAFDQTSKIINVTCFAFKVVQNPSEQKKHDLRCTFGVNLQQKYLLILRYLANIWMINCQFRVSTLQ